MAQSICLITGATDGVGRASALALAKKGFKVVLAARSQRKADALRAEIEAVAGVEADSILVDLTSLKQVRQAADTYAAHYSRLDVLLNNAGVFGTTRTLTEDGFESTFQVNYLSHFVLTQSLLGVLRNSEQGRVINLSSSIYSIGRFVPGDLQFARRYSVMGAYAASKLLVLMFTKELARRLSGTRVTANAAHPGVVRTQMMKSVPGALRLIALASLPFSVTPEEGARTPVFLATAPEVRDVTGEYFVRARATPTRNAFDTGENRALLWKLSVEAAG
jgi:NAD(P)-dependent dehydrogenase (short-subunit alcohol dehydrogenase family)